MIKNNDPFVLKFKTDTTGSRITNIPYNDYILPCEAAADALVPDISPEYTAEKNSAAINGAIAAACVVGGKTVLIPRGEYKITEIELKSDVTLFISSGAKLTAQTFEEREKSGRRETLEKSEAMFAPSRDHLHGGVIFAENAENIRITGGGVICGNGVSYTDPAKDETPFYPLEKFNTHKRVIGARNRIRFGKPGVKRNYLVRLKNCKNAAVDNVTLNESAFWTLVVDGCENVDIHNIVIDNHMHVANADGMDILFSRNVEIARCFIATADDGICLKPVDGEIENVRVFDCVVSSFANCFKIGTETAFDAKHITVKNCKFFIPSGMTYGYSGIAVESADGSNISDVETDGIEMFGISSPVLIWLGKRLRYGKCEIGGIKDIIIKNVFAVDIELPSAITGCRDGGRIYRPENIVFENVRVSYRDTKEKLNIPAEAPEWSAADYPDIVRVSHIYKGSHEQSDYFDLPCCGLFIRYAKNVKYSGYLCKPRECSELPLVFLKD